MERLGKKQAAKKERDRGVKMHGGVKAGGRTHRP